MNVFVTMKLNIKFKILIFINVMHIYSILVIFAKLI